MTLIEFKDALVSGLEEAGVPVYHALATPEDVCPVLCWQETGGSYLAGDDSVCARVMNIELDLYTDAEYDPAPAVLENLLETLQVSYYNDSIGYVNDRGEWTRTWTVSFIGG